MTHRYRRLAGLFVSFCLLLPGCGGATPVRVTGIVTLDGKPLNDGFVDFESDSSQGQSASCKTNEKGEFKFVPIPPHHVLAPGSYTVTFKKFDETKSKEQPGDGAVPNMARPNLVPRLYRNKTTSPFKVTLREGMNKLDPFELTGTKGAKGR